MTMDALDLAKKLTKLQLGDLHNWLKMLQTQSLQCPCCDSKLGQNPDFMIGESLQGITPLCSQAVKAAKAIPAPVFRADALIKLIETELADRYAAKSRSEKILSLFSGKQPEHHPNELVKKLASVFRTGARA